MVKTLLPYLVPFEKKLIKELGIKDRLKKPVIAISGLSGTGKDTHARLLQEKLEEADLKLGITVAGEYFRELARKEGFEEKNIDKFMEKYEKSENFAETVDKKVERATLENALRNGGILVGRMSAFAIGKWGFSILLTVSPEVAAQRMINDPKRAEFGLPI